MDTMAKMGTNLVATSAGEEIDVIQLQWFHTQGALQTQDARVNFVMLLLTL